MDSATLFRVTGISDLVPPMHSAVHFMADCDGAVIIPAALIKDVASRVGKLFCTESLVGKAIQEGVDPGETAATRFTTTHQHNRP